MRFYFVVVVVALAVAVVVVFRSVSGFYFLLLFCLFSFLLNLFLVIVAFL